MENETKETKTCLKIVNFGMRSHINMSNKGILNYSGTIKCEGHKLHDKTFYKQVVTPKKGGAWQEGKVYFSIEGYQNEFEKFEELLKYHNLPDLCQ